MTEEKGRARRKGFSEIQLMIERRNIEQGTVDEAF